jgi:hypothetical protein
VGRWFSLGLSLFSLVVVEIVTAEVEALAFVRLFAEVPAFSVFETSAAKLVFVSTCVAAAVRTA